MVAQAEQHPQPQQPPRADGCFDTLKYSLLEGVFVREDMIVRRLAPGSQYLKPVMRSTELVVVALEGSPCRSSVKESLDYLGYHHSGLPVQQTCLLAVVQLPRVTPEVRPPRTDPPVNLGRQVWRFIDGASKIGERGCLTVLLPRGV